MTVSPTTAAPLAAARARVARVDVAVVALSAAMAGQAALLAWLSVARYRAFWTGRFDLGNMTQAVWSTLHGHPLATTDLAGTQISRLAAHVDPVLVAFAPLLWVWPSPVSLLVAQALIVATGAVPIFALGRRWLGDNRLALAGAVSYLLYPALMWATLTEFHPVTLAMPLLAWCIWAAETRRDAVLVVCATLACLTKEEVGLSLVFLGLWMAVRHGRRRAGAILAAASAAWVAVAFAVIIPHFNGGHGSHFAARYGDLGGSTGAIARTLLTRPWVAIDQAVTVHRATYLLALLVPLAFLPLASPLLALCAAPELVLNLLSNWWPQHSVEYQYVAVPTPFLVASALLGLARLRAATRPRWLVVLTEPAGALALGLVALAVLSGVRLGPLPWWRDVPYGSQVRTDQYSPGAHARALDEAVALVPAGARVSAGNYLGSHLSERARIYTFPVVRDAQWVLVDRQRPAVGAVQSPAQHAQALADLMATHRFRVVMDRDGVLVLRRVEQA